ncbi:MAG: CBS domain-containing protein [Myxococcales bacterium]|nr:CBS domain-containing protein [Myxococcales bacterium]
MLVSELMSNDVLTIRADAPLTQAAAEMRLGRVRHLPVVDSKGKLVGLLSHLDVMKTLLRGKGTQVADGMSVRLVTVREDAQAADAAKLMRSRKVGSLPVIDEKGRLVGLLTEADFVDLAEQALRGKPLGRRG